MIPKRARLLNSMRNTVPVLNMGVALLVFLAFGAAGVADDGAITFVSEETDSWSVCEDPGLAPRFIVEREFLAERPVQIITNQWSGGYRQMNRQVPRWTGQPIWGSPTNRNIWLKFNVPKE